MNKEILHYTILALLPGQYSDSLFNSIYTTVNLNTFGSADAQSLKNQYSPYLELLKDQQNEYTFQPKLSNSIFRYFINIDRLMKVGDTIYKFFDDSFASCITSSYLDSLISISDSQFSSLNDWDTIGGILIRKFVKGGDYLGDYWLSVCKNPIVNSLFGGLARGIYIII